MFLRGKKPKVSNGGGSTRGPESEQVTDEIYQEALGQAVDAYRVAPNVNIGEALVFSLLARRSNRENLPDHRDPKR